MKIVHISYSDHAGGAAIAAARHHYALTKEGHDSHMLVIDKGLDDERIQPIPGTWGTFPRKVGFRLFKDAFMPFGTWSLAGTGPDISRHPLVKEADVVVLHWVNNWTVSLKSIEKMLAAGKQVVWFMHDMWPVTGGCHHAMDCRRFTTRCHNCPLLGRSAGIDFAARQFREKMQRLAPYPNLTFVAPSQWLAAKVKESALFAGHDVHVARNVVDMDEFPLRDKTEARRRLGLPAHRPLILFGADAISSPYKGWRFVREIIAGDMIDADWVVYGKIKSEAEIEGLKGLHVMGMITDRDKLVDLYNAADIFVSPSLADTFPNVVLEAQACGLPTLGFKTGGIPEMIVHGVNGYITESNDTAGLAEGIKHMLGHLPSDRGRIREMLAQAQAEPQLAAALQQIVTKNQHKP